MSPKYKLATVNQAVAVPGCRFTRTSLTLTTVNDATLARAGQYLQTFDACRAWWWGDFIVAYCQWKQAQEPTKTRGNGAQDVDAKYVHYTAEYSEATGVQPDTLHEWRAVATFYEVGRRRPTLSWSHHAEAKDGSGGNIAVAVAWLDRAEAEGWSKTQLRAAIREQARLPLNTEPRAPQTYAEVIAFKRWASNARKRLHSIDAREAATLRQDMEPARVLIHELDAMLSSKAVPKKITGPSQRVPAKVE